MQSLALEGAQRIDQFRRGTARLRKAAAVHRIADDGILLMRQMQADLMGSARLELHRQVGVGAIALQYPIMRHRRPPALTHGHAQPIAAIASDGRIDGTAPGHDAHAHRQILARHGARHELSRQRGLRFRAAGHNQQSAGVLVQPVNEACARQLPERSIPSQQGVLQGMARISSAWVHDQACRLVDDQHVRVFVDQAKCNRLGQYLRLWRLHAHLHAHMGTGFHEAAGLAALAPDPPRPLLDPPLDPGARMLRKQAGQSAVQPLTGQFRRNVEIDHLELCGHRALEATVGASGILPRFRAPPTQGPHCKESLVRLRDLVQPSRVLLLALGVMMLATGCRSHRADDAKSGPEQIYAKAQKAIRSGSYAEAVKQLEALQSRFPFSEPARQAQLDLIYAYYKNHEVDPAVDASDTFIRENPTNPRVDYAYYMKGLVYFERQSNWLERRFNVDLSQRPPVNAKKSFEAFPQLIEKCPHSQYIGDARQRMVFLRNRLADFELHVALYYMRRGAYVGAINRAKYCVENYDGAPAVKDSLKVIVNAYYDLNMTDLAANAERVYTANYPGSTKDIARKKAWYRRIF